MSWLASSIHMAIYACLKSKLEYITLPCKNCRVLFISGITALGDSTGLLVKKIQL
jgi:hypothetical protein